MAINASSVLKGWKILKMKFLYLLIQPSSICVLLFDTYFPFWFIFHLYSHKLCQIRAEMKQGNQIFAQTCFISKIFHSVELWEQKTRKDANSTSFLYFLSDASFYLIQIASFLLCSVIKFADVQYCYLITVPTFQILLLYNLVD